MGQKLRVISPAASMLGAILIILLGGSEARGPISSVISKRAPGPARPPTWVHQSRRKLLDNGVDTSAVGVTDIHDCENMQYTSTVGIGTPPQELKVTLSTGSYDLWVASSACDSCGAMTGYDSSASSTHVADGEEFNIDYGNGMGGTGFLSVDELTVGGLSTTVTFGEMMMAYLPEGCDEVDGLMGMGLSNEDGQNAFEDMLDAGIVDVPIFSFYMGNIDEGTPTGILTLGGVNQTHYEGCLEWVDVAESLEDFPDGFWSVVLKDLKLGSQSMIQEEATAVIDTATSLIIGPKADVGALAGELGAYCVMFTGSADSEMNQVDCVQDAEDVQLILMECSAEFDDINFFFGGDDFSLTPKELLQPLEDFEATNPSTVSEPWCLFGMVGADMEDTWILGDSFLRTFYTAYNVHERTVGLAQATSHRQGDACDADASAGAANPSPTSAENTEPATSEKSHGGSSAGDNDGGDDDDGNEGVSNAATAGHDESDEGDGEDKSKRPGMIAVVVPAVVGTVILFSAVVGLMLLGRQLWAGRQYRHAPLGDDVTGHEGGGGRGAFEMADKAIRTARHGREVPGPEDEFLQTGDPRGGSGGSKRFVIKGVHEEDGEDEVEVDLAGQGAMKGGAKAGVFGRLLNRPVGEGFAEFDKQDGLGPRIGGRQGDV